MYVRPRGRGPPPSGKVRTKLRPAAHIWPENLNFKFGIYLYLCRNFIVFVLNLVYLYIQGARERSEGKYRRSLKKRRALHIH